MKQPKRFIAKIGKLAVTNRGIETKVYKIIELWGEFARLEYFDATGERKERIRRVRELHSLGSKQKAKWAKEKIREGYLRREFKEFREGELVAKNGGESATIYKVKRIWQYCVVGEYYDGEGNLREEAIDISLLRKTTAEQNVRRGKELEKLNKIWRKKAER